MPLLPILLASGAALAFLYWYLQPTLRVTYIDLPVRDLPPELDGFKIAHLTDIHYDLPNRKTMSEKLLAKIIEATNAEKPDLICLTGDYVNRDPSPAKALAESLKQLRSTHGSYAVLGNHDHDGNAAVITCISIPSLPLVVVGFDDLWHRKFLPAIAKPLLDQAINKYYRHCTQKLICVHSMPGRSVVIGLSHNPDTADALLSFPLELLLSGHTHGGQVVVPFTKMPVLSVLRTIWNWMPRFGKPYVPGQRHFGAVKDWNRSSGLIPLRKPDGGLLNLYVSRGLGAHANLRFWCDPEIPLFTLRRISDGAKSQ